MDIMRRIMLCTIFSVGFVVPFGKVADANHATLKVVNNSSSSIIRFYASPYWYPKYTGDRLGKYVIYPGQYWYVDLSDQETNNCIYDVKVILQNRQTLEYSEINVCEKTLTIYNK